MVAKKKSGDTKFYLSNKAKRTLIIRESNDKGELLRKHEVQFNAGTFNTDKKWEQELIENSACFAKGDISIIGQKDAEKYKSMAAVETETGVATTGKKKKMAEPSEPGPEMPSLDG